MSNLFLSNMIIDDSELEVNSKIKNLKLNNTSFRNTSKQIGMNKQDREQEINETIAEKLKILFPYLNDEQIKDFAIKSNNDFGLVIQNINNEYFNCDINKSQDDKDDSSCHNKRRSSQILEIPNFSNFSVSNSSNDKKIENNNINVENQRRGIVSLKKLRQNVNNANNSTLNNITNNIQDKTNKVNVNSNFTQNNSNLN